MHIDWASLALVAATTVVAAIAIVGIFSLGVAALTSGRRGAIGVVGARSAGGPGLADVGLNGDAGVSGGEMTAGAAGEPPIADAAGDGPIGGVAGDGLTAGATAPGGGPTAGARLAGYACLTISGLLVLYGLYLIIPQFH